ncbi:hypothetical protein [Pseudarthrobacter sp. PS3-L1]|uniref:hypothetical protein n=1 Tax=Pseudarthrobacter sp. PS3-L1 TaxID=3046207 RepID=UPI0024BAFD0D|nr:hypothetical protein [Pseudarthrobacter sp. PS3-L1]MDJ0321823.1 hypothetical protein [Pseudarthrobacter sp. PS3-L1]
MTYKVWAVNAVTWSDKVLMEPTSMPWAETMNDGQGGTATFNLGDPSVAEVAGPFSLSPIDHLLVVEEAGKPTYAGFITDHDYDMDTQTLTVQHNDLWWLLKRRLLTAMVAPKQAPVGLGLSGSLANIAKYIVAEGLNDLPQSRYRVPMVFPQDQAGPHSRQYQGHNFPMMVDALTDIINTAGGPNVAFRPQWTNNGQDLEWLLRIGDLKTNTWQWNIGADQSPARKMRMRRSAEKLVTKIVAAGEGTGTDTLVQVVNNFPVTTYPALDLVESFKDEKSMANLLSRTQGALSARTIPTWQGSFEVPHDGEPSASQILVGDEVIWSVVGDPYINPGLHRWRIIEISGDLGPYITLNIQPLT